LAHGSVPSGLPTAYEILAVHPSAPAELLNVAYWMTVEEIQTARESGLPLDSALHLVTRAYEKVSKPEVRAGYNLSIGHTRESMATRALPRGRLPFSRPTPPIDHYEVLGLHETAPAALVSEAYRIMRALYGRLPVTERHRRRLLALLESAHSTIADERSRARWDRRRRDPARRGTGRKAKPSPAGAGRLSELIGRLVSAWGRPAAPSMHTSMLERLSPYLEQQA
jgi:hypothetical protein